MADFTWKPIESIREGEYVIGFERLAPLKHLGMKPTKVIQTVCRPRSQTIRIMTDKGSVVCTPDHRFWHCTPGIRRTWKRARSFRPGNGIRFVVEPFDHQETLEFQRGWLAGVAAGDGCFWNFRTGSHQYRRFRLAVKDNELIEAFVQRAHQLGYNLYIAPHTHTGFNRIQKERMPAAWLVRDKICQQFEARLNQSGDGEYSRGWLAGFFDAEGTFSGYVNFAQPEHSEHLITLSRHLNALGFRWVKTERGVRLGASIQEGIRFFSQCPPTLRRKLNAVYGASVRAVAEVQAVLPTEEAETYNLATETHNYVAEGFLVKNCDTEYAFYGGQKMTIDEVIERVKSYPTKLVEITGGEPLVQKEVYPLTERLLNLGYTVLIETSGSLDISHLDPRVICIMDLKAPGSGHEHSNRWENIEHLKPEDQVKFVIADRQDFDWACGVIERYNLNQRATVLFSPAWGICDPKHLAEWVLQSGVEARLQLQLHKYIWGPDVQGV